MAKPLSERFVQQSVAERLNAKYYRRKSAYVSTEVYTRLKRADVLLAFMRARGRPYVVVVEAKSRTTIHQLKLKNNRKKADWAGRILSLLLIAGLTAVLGYQWYFNATNTLLLLVVFLLGSLGISATISRLRLSFAQSISAIEQLGRYPANESWIAVGDDTFVNDEELQTLDEQCRKNGVGLIIVNGKGRLRLRVIPRPRHVFNDYLSRYGRRDSILQQIDQRPDYGPTPPERKLNRRRFGNIALLLGVTGILILLVYENRYGAVVPDPFASPRGVVIGTDAVGLPEGPGGDLPGKPAPARAATSSRHESGTAPCPEITRNERAFVVVDAVLEVNEAAARQAELAAAGIRGHQLMAPECLNGPLGKGVVIYTGRIYPSLQSAEAAAKAYRRIVRQLGVSRGTATVENVKTEK